MKTESKNPDHPRVPSPPSGPDDFAKMSEERQPGFFSEFWSFIRYNKKWWLTPILVILLLLIVLVIVSQTPLAPFIYPFF